MNDDDSPRISIFGLSLVFLTPALGGFLFGNDIGATSFVLEIMLRGCEKQCWWNKFHSHHTLQQGLFVSATSLGALLGSHIVLFHLVKHIGRRTEIRTCAVLCIYVGHC